MLRFYAIALLASCSAALAGNGQPDDAVVVTTLRNPVAKSYRKMVDGAKLFEQRRHLAPAASLAFKVLPRQHEIPMEGIRLELAAERLVIPNRKAGTVTWRADVRTPGLPPDTRRLGDLRLECEVGMQSGLISKYPRAWLDWLDELLPEGPAYCHRAAPNYLFFAERALFSVTLVDGSRREVLPVDRLYSGASRDPDWKKHLPHCDCAALLDRAYFVPLGDPGWPDDTRVELEYMDGES